VASTVVVNILGNNRSLNSALDQSEGRMSKFGGVMKSAAKTGALAFAAVAAVAVKAGIDAVQAASDLNEVVSKTETVFGKSADSILKFADTADTAIGLSKQAALEGASGFGNFFTQIGIGERQAANMSKTWLTMSADMASFHNAAPTDVMEALQAATRGEYDTLQKFIPTINAAKVEQKALALTGKDTAKSLTDQEKALAVYKLTMEGQGKAQGDFARTSGSLANQQRILKAQLSNVQAEIGQKLLPVAVQLFTWFNDKGIPILRVFGAWLEDHIPPAIAKVQEIFERFFGGQGTGKFAEFWSQVKEIWNNGVQIVTILWRNFGGNIIGFLRGWVKSIAQIIKGVWQIIRGIFKVFSALLKGDWKGVWKGIQLILKGAANIVIGLVKNLWNTVKFAFKNAGVVLKAVMKAAWDGIVNLVKAGAGRVVDAVKAVPGKIRDVGSKFLDAGKDVIGKIFDGIKSGAGGVVGFIADIASSIKNAINDALHLPFKIEGPGPLPDFTIPAFAKGGIVRGPTLALIGEDGPEAVVPLREQGSLGLGGNVYKIYVTVAPTASPADAGREIIKAIEAFEGAGGRVVAR